jgi:hypothetical protein
MSLTRTATIGQAAPITQNFKAEIVLEGNMKVLEVNCVGGATQSECAVSRCTLNGNPVCKAGDVIKAGFADGKKRYLVNGEKADDATATALGNVMPCANPASISSDDLLFGTDKPQKVGDSWPVHAAAMADSLAKNAHLTVEAEDVHGSSKLVSVKQVEGDDVLSLEVDATLDGARPTLPPDSVVGKSVMTIHMSTQLPADQTRQPLRRSDKMHAEFHATMPAPNNQKAQLDMNMDEVIESTFGQTKAAP